MSEKRKNTGKREKEKKDKTEKADKRRRPAPEEKRLELKISIIGADELLLGPAAAFGVLKTKNLKGSTLALIDVNRNRAEAMRGAVERMNRSMGNGFEVKAETDMAAGIRGADYVLLAGESGRLRNAEYEYSIPKRYGSKQFMGSNAGPGGVFHAFRNIKHALDVCRLIEREAPDAFLINRLHPMGSVALAIDRAAKVKCAGICNDYHRGVRRLSLLLLMPPERIQAHACGMSHFSWFHEIRDADTGEDLYPKLKSHAKRFPYLHEPLARECLKTFGLYPVGGDTHIGEFLSPEMATANPVAPFYRLLRNGREIRNRLTEWYGKGFFPLPAGALPYTRDEAMRLIVALASRQETSIDSVNLRNGGRVPNLPAEMIVEGRARTRKGKIVLEPLPRVPAPLAKIMRLEFKTQTAIVDAALSGNPDLALKAVSNERFAPPKKAELLKMFDEMYDKELVYLPF